MREQDLAEVNAELEDEAAWAELVWTLANASLLPSTKSVCHVLMIFVEEHRGLTRPRSGTWETTSQARGENHSSIWEVCHSITRPYMHVQETGIKAFLYPQRSKRMSLFNGELYSLRDI